MKWVPKASTLRCKGKARGAAGLQNPSPTRETLLPELSIGRPIGQKR